MMAEAGSDAGSVTDGRNGDDPSFNPSVLNSPSMGSISSSIFNSLRIDDDGEDLGGPSDFSVKVDNPEKHVTTMETFITFRVTLQTTRAEFNNSEYQVRRRYNDFRWLRSRLEAENATHIIPPLPDKHNLKEQLDRYGREFILHRMFLLNKFLQRLADHPVLSYDKNLIAFLTNSPAEFSCHKRQTEGILARVSTSMHQVSHLGVYLTKPHAPEFENVGTYATKLGDKLGFIEKLGQRIHQERLHYGRELRSLGPAMLLWANCEPDLKPNLQTLASTIDTCVKANETMTSAHYFKFLLPLREYSLWVDAIKAALKRRDNFQSSYESSVDDLERKRADRALANDGWGDGIFSSLLLSKDGAAAQKRVREQKLDSAIEDARKGSGEKGDRSEIADADVRADFERWTATKDSDLRLILLSHARRQVQMYEQSVAAWENALSGMQTPSPVQ